MKLGPWGWGDIGLDAALVHQIVEGFHRAAIGAGSWRDALAAFTAHSGGHIGQIVGVDRNNALIVNLVTGASSQQIDEYVETGGPDPKINPRSRAVLAAPPLTTLAEADFGSYEALRRHPYYQGFFAKNDVPYAALTKLLESDGRTVVMALMRSEGQGHLTDDQRKLIDMCAPRIRDAVATGLALERRQLDLIGGTLDHLDIAAFAVNAQGGIVSLSQAGEALLAGQDYLGTRGRALIPLLAERQAAFVDAIQSTRRDLPALERRATKLLLPSIADGPTLLAEVFPLPIDSEGWLHTACCLVTVRRRGERLEDLPNYLHERYRLTPSECAIVLHLVDGLTPRAIADARGVGEGTVRNQIKAILAKTGFGRQIDLVRELRH